MRSRLNPLRAAAAALLVSALLGAGCGGGGGDPAPPGAELPPPGPGPAHTVGGTVSGLAGSGLVLQLNGAGDLPVQTNGAFAFNGALAAGSTYTVTVLARPARPSQSCTVGNGSGTANANITTVQVSCSTDPLMLLSIDPADRAGEVARTVQPALAFSAALDAATVSGSSVVLAEAGGAPAANTLTPAGASIGIAPALPLWPDTEYRLEVNSVLGSFGEVLAAPVNTRFVTRDGQWTPAPVTAMQTLPQFEGESHRVAMARDGSAVAAWRAPDSANGWRSFTTRRGTDGRWEAPIEVGASIPGDHSPPVLAMAPDGSAHIAWSTESGIGGRQQVYASHRGPADAGWSAPVQLSIDTALTNVEPALGAGAGGAVYAAWISGSSAPYDIHLARRQDDGSWSAPIVVNEANGRSVFGPAVAVAGNGHATLAWAEQNGADYALKWRAYRPDVSAPEPLAPAADVGGPVGHVSRLSLALNAGGDAALAWHLINGPPRTIWAAVKSASASQWSPALPLDGDATDDHAPQIAVDEIGDVLAAWEGAEPGGLNRVFARRFDRGSAIRNSGGWSDLRELSDASGGNRSTLAVDARGNALVLWQPTNSEVRGARFTKRQGWQPAATVARLGAAGSLFAPRVAFDGSGSAVSIWVETDLALRTGQDVGFAIGGARFD